MRSKATVYERRRRRLKYKGKERDFLGGMLEQRAAQMRKTADELEQNTKIIGDRALELLKDFEYRAEEGPLFSYATFREWG
jgi:hypothetical protein